MNVEKFFEQQKGITVDAARNANVRYTAIDLCRFAQNYRNNEVINEFDSNVKDNYDENLISIEDLDITIRCHTQLKKTNFKYLNELCDFKKEDLFKYFPLGKKSLEEINEQMKIYKLSFK